MSRILDRPPRTKRRKGEVRRRKRARLHREQDGKCYWCHHPTVLLAYADPGEQLDHHATLDHLDDRFSADRGKHTGERRVVMACRKCNNERGILRQAMQPIEELRRRAAHEPRRLLTYKSTSPAASPSD